MKKFIVVLIALLINTFALAANSNDAIVSSISDITLIAPHQEGSWSFGLQANYLEPNNDFNYAFATESVTNSDDTLTNKQAKTYAVDSNYDWGWGADITYHFPGEGRDVTLAFTQLNTSDSDSLNNEDSSEVFRAFGSSFDKIDAKVSTDYNAVDLIFGQVIDVGHRLSLHPFAGLRYADIDYKVTGEYTAYNPTKPRSEHLISHLSDGQLNSEFEGIGPRLGSDATVNLGSGFSLRGTLGISLLVGSMDMDTKIHTTLYPDRALPQEFNNKHDVDTNTQVIPEADAKLSALYHRNLENGYGLNFEAGYQVSDYFNAIQNSTLGITFDTLLFSNTTNTHTNFFMQGPYARIQLDAA